MKIRKRNGTVIDVPENYVLQDGETLTVPVMMMDSVRRTVITDGRGGPAGCRPGFLVSDTGADVAEAVRITAYAQYDADISQRWRSDRWQGGPSKPAPQATFDSSPAARDASYAQYRADIENRWRK